MWPLSSFATKTDLKRNTPYDYHKHGRHLYYGDRFSLVLFGLFIFLSLSSTKAIIQRDSGIGPGRNYILFTNSPFCCKSTIDENTSYIRILSPEISVSRSSSHLSLTLEFSLIRLYLEYLVGATHFCMSNKLNHACICRASRRTVPSSQKIASLFRCVWYSNIDTSSCMLWECLHLRIGKWEDRGMVV